MEMKLIPTMILATGILAPFLDGSPRARDLGIPFHGEPGPENAITDVPGVTVGHATLIRAQA